MSSYLITLRDDLWRTSSARYNAARRLKRKELFSTISLAFFSALAIALAVIQQIYTAQIEAAPGLSSYITAISTLSGIFILVISLMEWGSRNGSNADALYKNAQELNALRQKICLQISKEQASSLPNWSVATEHLRTYEQIQDRCDINHAPIDDGYFVSQHRNSPEFKAKQISDWDARRLSALWHLSSIWYYLIFWSVMIVALVPIVMMINFLSFLTCGGFVS